MTRIYIRKVLFRHDDGRRRKLPPIFLADWFCPRTQRARFVRNTPNTFAKLIFAQKSGYWTITGGDLDSYIDV